MGETPFMRAVAACLLSALAAAPAAHCAGQASADAQPVIPVGLDSFRMWDQWPSQRIGARAYMRSTYDRSGGNEGADASHFLYQLHDDFNVALDLEGPGLTTSIRWCTRRETCLLTAVGTQVRRRCRSTRTFTGSMSRV